MPALASPAMVSPAITAVATGRKIGRIRASAAAGNSSAVAEHLGQQRRALPGPGPDAGRAQEDARPRTGSPASSAMVSHVRGRVSSFAELNGEHRHSLRSGRGRRPRGVRRSTTSSRTRHAGVHELVVERLGRLAVQLDTTPRRRRGRRGRAVARRARRRRRRRRACRSRAVRSGPGGGRRVSWATSRPLRHHGGAGADQLDLAEQVARQEHRRALAAPARRAASGSRGCPAGRGRWWARRASSRRGWRIRAAARPSRWRMPSRVRLHRSPVDAAEADPLERVGDAAPAGGRDCRRARRRRRAAGSGARTASGRSPAPRPARPTSARMSWALPGIGRPSSSTRPAVGAHQAEEHPDGGRLARPVRPEEAEHVALVDLEVDVVDHRQAPVALGEAFGAHDRGHGLLARSGRGWRRCGRARPP